MKPRIPVTDPAFVYTDAASTDIRKTFAKARRRLAEEAKRDEAERGRKVTELRRKA